MRMVHVGNMRMAVAHRAMLVGMGVRLSGRIVRPVAVAMMVVMHMRMVVRQRFMVVHMGVPLGQMQPDTEAHQKAGKGKLNCQRIAKKSDRRATADKRRG